MDETAISTDRGMSVEFIEHSGQRYAQAAVAQRGLFYGQDLQDDAVPGHVDRFRQQEADGPQRRLNPYCAVMSAGDASRPRYRSAFRV